MSDDRYNPTRHEDESPDDYMLRLALTLQDCASELAGVKQRVSRAADGWNYAEGQLAAYRRAEELANAGKPTMSSESPFIRQHNEISKMVADLLKEPPGPGKALVRFLAATLDMELPEQWRESQN